MFYKKLDQDAHGAVPLDMLKIPRGDTQHSKERNSLGKM